jgi:D-aminoacyl-tRNA deacylase
MLALVQRVKRASVEIEEVQCAQIEQGMLVFVCAMPGDLPEVSDRLLQKLLSLRIFPDLEGDRMNRNLRDVGGGLLLVSQFTLAADMSRGTRPGFSGAAAPALAFSLFEELVAKARSLHAPVQSGVFGANMQVHLINDGPVTLWLDIH